MTPTEHYNEAEKDIELANSVPINSGEDMFFLGRAQVHATLALSNTSPVVYR